jgi:hypothetical protein
MSYKPGELQREGPYLTRSADEGPYPTRSADKGPKTTGSADEGPKTTGSADAGERKQIDQDVEPEEVEVGEEGRNLMGSEDGSNQRGELEEELEVGGRLKDVGRGHKGVGTVHAKYALPGRRSHSGCIRRLGCVSLASSSGVLLLCVLCVRRTGRKPLFLLMSLANT